RGRVAGLQRLPGEDRAARPALAPDDPAGCWREVTIGPARAGPLRLEAQGPRRQDHGRLRQGDDAIGRRAPRGVVRVAAGEGGALRLRRDWHLRRTVHAGYSLRPAPPLHRGDRRPDGRVGLRARGHGRGLGGGRAPQDSMTAARSFIQLCDSMEYLERAFDDAKYGRASTAPYSDGVLPTIVDDSLAPAGKHIMSCFSQYVPASWSKAPHRQELE